MDRERKAFEEWSKIRFEWGADGRPYHGALALCHAARQQWEGWQARAALDAPPAEPTEAMVEAGARALLRGAVDGPVAIRQEARRFALACYEAVVVARVATAAAQEVALGLLSGPERAEPHQRFPVYIAAGELSGLVRRAVASAMRAESEGGGVATERAQGEEIRGDGDDHGSRPISPPVVTAASADPRQHRKAPPSVTPPSPGSDLLREVEEFLRALGASAYIDTKDAATARDLADELRAMIEGGHHDNRR